MPNDVLLDLGKTKCGFGRSTLLWLILFYSNLPLKKYNYDKKVHTVVINNSTKTNNHLIEHKENPRHMALEIQILILDMHKSVADLKRLVVIYLLGHSKSLSYELS